jgi:hypothetical protein
LKETSSKENQYEIKPRKPRRSIDLNIPASEEDQDQDREKKEDVPEKQGLEEYRTIIEDLRQHNQRLEVWNAKLQEKVQKLKEKHKKQHDFTKKIRKKNIKLYWTNVVLKTKLKQEISKGQTSAQG